MGMARLFFHNPKFGVLDECTNATSVDIEEHLYRCHSQAISRSLCTPAVPGDIHMTGYPTRCVPE